MSRVPGRKRIFIARQRALDIRRQRRVPIRDIPHDLASDLAHRDRGRDGGEDRGFDGCGQCRLAGGQGGVEGFHGGEGGFERCDAGGVEAWDGSAWECCRGERGGCRAAI
jgi:hypothetical protein